jgi:hypothetical protein
MFHTPQSNLIHGKEDEGNHEREESREPNRDQILLHRDGGRRLEYTVRDNPKDCRCRSITYVDDLTVLELDGEISAVCGGCCV